MYFCISFGFLKKKTDSNQRDRKRGENGKGHQCIKDPWTKAMGVGELKVGGGGR